MATHSSVLAWRIPGTGEPGGLPSMGLKKFFFQICAGQYCVNAGHEFATPSSVKYQGGERFKQGLTQSYLYIEGKLWKNLKKLEMG